MRKRTARRLVTVIAVAGLAALIAVPATIAIVENREAAKPAAIDTGITRTIDASAHRVVLAPGGADWWVKVVAMMPTSTGYAKADTSTMPVEVSALGYSESLGAPGEAMARHLHMETASDHDAELLVRWLDEQASVEFRSSAVLGNVVVTGPGYQGRPDMPEDSIQQDEHFTPQAPAGQAIEWVDFDAQAKNLGNTKKLNEAVAEALPKLRGLKGESVWTGASEDGKTWKGEWVTGGFDPELVDFDAAAAALEKTTSEASLGREVEAPMIDLIDGGATDVFTDAQWINIKTQQSIGNIQAVLMPTGTASGELEEVTSQRYFNYALDGAGWQDEEISYNSWGFTPKGATHVMHD